MARALRVEDLELPKLRCAPFHSSLDVDPAGTAGAYDAFLCVEVPLPWERDISLSEPFLSLAGAGTAKITAGDGRTVRPQGLVPRPGAEGWTRVLLLERPPATASDAGAAGPYQRREWWVLPEEVAGLCSALVDVDPSAVAEYDGRLVEVPDGVVDVFVCTHGKRDACCGSSGASLHDLLAARLAALDPAGERARPWRVSHTGGHRFAPTVLTFPDGYAWAHLDPEQAVGLALRSIDPADLAGHCRGAACLPGGPVQAADAAALVELGWSWAAAPRTATVTGFDRGSLATTVRLDATLDGAPVRRELRVELDRHVPQITCGAIDGPEYAVEPVWRVAPVAGR